MKRRQETDQTASEIVPENSKALRKPGITREAVFGRDPNTNVVAYWLDPTDVTRIVRVAADGTKTVGRMTRGSLRAIRSK